MPSSVDAIEETIEELVACCVKHGCEGPKMMVNFRVAAAEVLSNAVMHGNGENAPQPVHVHLYVFARRVALRVRDYGNGFDPNEVPDPTNPENLERPCGRGVLLIRSLMTHVEYNARGNAVTCVLHL